jgi:hypothetical protein
VVRQCFNTIETHHPSLKRCQPIRAPRCAAIFQSGSHHDPLPNLCTYPKFLLRARCAASASCSEVIEFVSARAPRGIKFLRTHPWRLSTVHFRRERQNQARRGLPLLTMIARGGGVMRVNRQSAWHGSRKMSPDGFGNTRLDRTRSGSVLAWAKTGTYIGTSI